MERRWTTGSVSTGRSDLVAASSASYSGIKVSTIEPTSRSSSSQGRLFDAREYAMLTGVWEEDPMKPRRISPYGAMVALLLTVAVATAEEEEPAATAEEPAAPSVADLGWMTGTWSGPVGGGNVLEENWTTPRSGSIQSLVRMTGPRGTSMVELIVIEEEEGTLRLRLQQWDPGLKPRTPEPNVMKLVDMGENTVAFESENEGGIAKLRYTRDGDNFTIGITNPTGASFDLPLKSSR